MTAVAGVLGSLIGYLGAEVSEETIFERLLWPQRFYHHLNLEILLKMIFLMPMGGPLHRAALQTLDTFHERGLYDGPCRGNMIGTAFLRNSRHTYRVRTIQHEREIEKEARNGFWIEVLKHVKPKSVKAPLPFSDPDSRYEKLGIPLRAKQRVFHLVLRPVRKEDTNGKNACIVQEDKVTWRSFVGIVASELSAFAIALAVGIRKRRIWLALYLMVPLLFKLLAVLVSLRRESLVDFPPGGKTANPPQDATEIFEVAYSDRGFTLIEGADWVVRQFFRHYGHPKRDQLSILRHDRAREIACMALVYAFVLYFPAGLLSLLWMEDEVQYLWLGYQIYIIIAMHLVRLAGCSDCGRTEERIGLLLGSGRTVWLRSTAGYAVAATLETMEVESVKAGRERVQEMIEGHGLRRLKALPVQDALDLRSTIDTERISPWIASP